MQLLQTGKSLCFPYEKSSRGPLATVVLKDNCHAERPMFLWFVGGRWQARKCNRMGYAYCPQREHADNCTQHPGTRLLDASPGALGEQRCHQGLLFPLLADAPT